MLASRGKISMLQPETASTAPERPYPGGPEPDYQEKQL
jgi:hypothetical protein